MITKNILITGADGYIGTNLKLTLAREGYNIIQVDKEYCTYAELVQNYADPTHDEYSQIFETIDFIVHLGAISGIKNCADDPLQATIDNVQSTTLLMKYANDNKIPLIFASSQAAKDPSSSFYASTKYMGEANAKDFNEMDGMNVVLRFANVYGGEKSIGYKTSVISKFLSDWYYRRMITIDGTGEQRRDFLHVNDICYTISELISYYFENGADEFKEDLCQVPFDVGTGISYSINDVKKIMDRYADLQWEYNDKSDGGAATSVADVEPLEKILKCKPSDSLKDYLIDMLENYDGE